MTSRVSPAAAFAAAFIALWSLVGLEALAQDASPPAAPSEPVLNATPRPYNSLRPRRVRPRP
uniref:hypothetical protein n=1 Tax=uncultured Caulobacter sp. TaxID=158749 RepID=UPI0025F49FEE